LFESLDVIDQCVGGLLEQIQLLHGEVLEMLQVVFDRFDDLPGGALQRAHKIGCDRSDDRAKEEQRSHDDPDAAHDL
jgi:hypothetical protein